MPPDKPAGFSISVFGRFAYTLSAPDVHYLGRLFVRVRFLGNVRPYQTTCTRTAGHLISEKPAGLSGGNSCLVSRCCRVMDLVFDFGVTLALQLDA